MPTERAIRFADRLNLIQIAAWTLLALRVLPSHGHFLYDEAYFYHQAIALAGHPTLPAYGPPISGTDPTAFTPGGLLYVVLSVPFFFVTDPRAGVMWLIVLSALGVWWLDRAFKTYGIAPEIRVFVIAIMTWTGWHAREVDRIWNTHVFWGLPAAMLAVTLLLMRKPAAQSWMLMSVFGALCALAVQAHLGGGLAVAACGFLLLSGNIENRWSLRRWLPFALVVCLLYLPYIVVECTHSFQDLHWMASSHAFTRWNQAAATTGSLAPFSYLSVFPGSPDPRQTVHELLDSVSLGNALRIGFVLLSAGGVALFFSRPSPLRLFVIFCWAIIPVYVILNQREFYDSYVAALMPYFSIPLGWGLATLFRKGRWHAGLSVAFLGLWVIVQSASWVPEYLADSHVPTLKSQLVRARTAGAYPLPVGIGDVDAFVLWSLAEHHYQRDLPFLVQDLDRVCHVRVGARPLNVLTAPLGWDSYFLCQ